MEYGKKHIYLTWTSDVRLLNFLVMNNRCVLPAQHTVFHFALFWFLWYIYDVKRLEQRQSVPQSKGESYRCSALLAPCKPVQEYQSAHLSYYPHIVLSANAISKLWRMVPVYGTTFRASTQTCSYSDILIYWVTSSSTERRLELVPVVAYILYDLQIPFWKCFFSSFVILKWPDRLKLGHTKIYHLRN